MAASKHSNAPVQLDPDSLKRLPFEEAAKVWLLTRKPYLRPSTWEMYAHHVSRLGKFFDGLLIRRITLGHLREYQRVRVANTDQRWDKVCGPSIINHEMSCLQQILKRAGMWSAFADFYEPLPLPAFTKKKVMTDEEEYRLFRVGSRNPEWELAYRVASFTVNTTASGSELRNILLEHIMIDVDQPRFLVASDHAKNGFRGRSITLNTSALAHMRFFLQRAKHLGSFLPEHHLFPLRISTGKFDPLRAASPSWIAKPFKQLRAAADLPWITPHCMRHQSITKLLEAGVPSEIVRAAAGHVSEEMMRHYSHPRFEALGAAFATLERKPVRLARSAQGVARPLRIAVWRRQALRGKRRA